MENLMEEMVDFARRKYILAMTHNISAEYEERCRMALAAALKMAGEV